MLVRLAKESDRDYWNAFVSSSPRGSFLQSWEWGDVQLQLGIKIWRLIVEEKGWQGVILLLKRPQPLGKSWLYAPRGPVVAQSNQKVWSELQAKLLEIGKEERAIFVRVDPPASEAAARLLFEQPGWQKSEREVQPRHTLLLDLAKSEEELLAAMHHKTRYNIRLAQKKGVTVRFSRDRSDIKHFLRLAKDVSGRTNFSYHPDEYYEALMRVLGEKGLGEIALAQWREEVLAAHIIVSFGKVVTYMHGASSSKMREVMAPHLLQWETIRRARERGYRFYDFFGVAPKTADRHHPWAGITRFKEGFAGQRAEYIGAYDLVLQQSVYHLFNAARRLKSFMR